MLRILTQALCNNKWLSDVLNAKLMRKKEQLQKTKVAGSNLEFAVQSMLSAFPNNAKQRHLVLILDPDLDPAFRVPDHWAALFAQHGVSAQVLIYKPLEPDALASWRNLCLASKGILIQCKQVHDLGAAMVKLSSYLHSGFSLTYQLIHIVPQTGGPETLFLDVTTPLGCGQMAVDGTNELVPEVACNQEMHSDAKTEPEALVAVEGNSDG